LDGTLAESKSSLDPEMSKLLHNLLGIVKVAVISEADWPQFEKHLLSNLPHDEWIKIAASETDHGTGTRLEETAYIG